MKKNLLLLLPLLLLACGIYFVPLRIMHTDFSMIPGDMGDARFNNYVLEHGYKFFTGQTDKFWDAPFMYPLPNVIALSDNLLGTLPVYSAFRFFADRETAFQYWILALFILNYICCYWALKKWSQNILLSSVGAYIFAFSIFTAIQLNHVQVLPRFIVPLVLYWCWKYLKEKESRYFLFMMLGIVYQFYCGVYLGFLLIYILLFFFIAYLLFYKSSHYFQQFKSKKLIFRHLLVMGVFIILLAPLMLPYLKVSRTMGMRTFEAVSNSIPHLRSYFFTSPISKVWSPMLYNHGVNAFPDWCNHFLFLGALPWLSILLLPLLFFSKKVETTSKKFIAFLCFALLLSIIFCLNLDGFTLYHAIFLIPGFSSMRSLDRLINTEAMLFILILIFVFKELSTSFKAIKWLMLALPVLVVVDNFIDPSALMAYEKSESQEKVKDVRKQIEQLYDKQKYTAIIYMPMETYVDDPAYGYIVFVEKDITAMLAAQESNIPCVNGYTGFLPGPYETLFYYPNDQTIAEWCTYAHGNPQLIQRINEIGKKETIRKMVHIKAFNDKYVCANEGGKPIVTANREKASSWESFTFIGFANNECSLKANTNLFFSAQPDGNTELTASRPKVAGWEVFTMIDLGNKFVAFKASNGKYVSCDATSLQLFANSEAITDSCKFRMEYY